MITHVITFVRQKLPRLVIRQYFNRYIYIKVVWINKKDNAAKFRLLAKDGFNKYYDRMCLAKITTKWRIFTSSVVSQCSMITVIVQPTSVYAGAT
jgi:hypothetical protein